jgi:hypothetical protein
MSETTISELRKALITLERIKKESVSAIDPVPTSLVWDIESVSISIKDDNGKKVYVVLEGRIG